MSQNISTADNQGCRNRKRGEAAGREFDMKGQTQNKRKE